MLELDNIHSGYGDIFVVREVSLKVEPGTVVALLGRNGMGKTTLVHTIMGLIPVRIGRISFNGNEISNLPAYRISHKGLSLVPQGRRIFPSLTVRENLVLAMRGTGCTLKKIHSLFPVLEGRARNKGHQLSGGEQQMLAIARAMLSNPQIILMDEPSEGLAPIIIEEIGNIILDLKRQGLAVLLVEQNVSLALKVSDYAYILHKGSIVHHCEKPELAVNEEIQREYIGVSKYEKDRNNCQCR